MGEKCRMKSKMRTAKWRLKKQQEHFESEMAKRVKAKRD